MRFKILLLFVFFIAISCKEKIQYQKNDGAVILKYGNHTDTLLYHTDSIQFMKWKNIVNLKPGDTAIFEIDGEYVNP